MHLVLPLRPSSEREAFSFVDFCSKLKQSKEIGGIGERAGAFERRAARASAEAD